MKNTTECPCFFTWNGYSYLIIGFSGYFRTIKKKSSEYIPAWKLNENIYDGLCVPMVSEFKDNRRIISGWLNGVGWGSVIAHRELIQGKDGKIGSKWLKEIVPKSNNNTNLCKETVLTPKKDYLLELDIKNITSEVFAIQFSDDKKDCCNLQILNDIKREYLVASVGLTGQMHGILFVNKNGKAVSPLYTWQDQKGNQIIFGKNISYCEEMQEITGEKISSGYGFSSCYYLLKNKMIDKNAEKICTVMDYLGMRLCGNSTPVVHSSNASSMGFFDNKALDFNYDSLKKLGLDVFAPKVVSDNTVIGYYDNTPVFVAVGDNQASVFASIGMDNSKILVNFGTGSQISAISESCENAENCEIRPYFDNKYLLVGSALCGGKAYAVLEGFFRSYSKELGHGESQFEILNKLALEGMKNESPIKVDTRFCGTREDTGINGSITNLTDKNFNASNIVYATICGMVEELYKMYENMGIKDISSVIASGNAVKKNEVLRKVIEKYFNSKVQLLPLNEEAAFGAAMLCKR